MGPQVPEVKRQSRQDGEQLLYRCADGAVLRAIEGEDGQATNQFELSFSSEAPCSGWWGNDEILVHDAAAVNLTRLKDVGALLFAHGGDVKYGKLPIGGIVSAELDLAARRCKAIIEIDNEDEDAMEIARKMQKGYLTGVSVGCIVHKWQALREDEISADGRFEGPIDLAIEWEPIEISIEPTPADATVGVGRSVISNYMEEAGQMAKNGQIKGRGPKYLKDQKTTGRRREADPVVPPEEEEDLEEELEGELADALDEGLEESDPPEDIIDELLEDDEDLERDALDDEDTDEDVERGVKTERRRVRSITKLCRQYGIRPDKYIERGVSVAQMRSAILRSLSKTRKPVGGNIRVVREEMDKFSAAAVDSLLMRGSMAVKDTATGANELRGMRLRDLAIETLGRSGVSGAHRMDDEKLFRAVLSPDSAFVGIVSNAVSKSMAVAYEAAPPTYPLWTSKGSNPDFKPRQIIQISEAGNLEEVAQNGELKMDHPFDTDVYSVLTTFGKTFGFTRKALINDDIDLLTKLPAAYVRAALRGTNQAVYNILAENPVMRDGQRLFSAAHGNLGTGAKPSIESYNEAMAGMMHQKGLRGEEALNITPAYILSDPIQYADHAVMLTSMANPQLPNSGTTNPFMGMMQLVMDAELTKAKDGTAYPYFFAASPYACGTIEVSHLNGNEEPTLDYEVGFDYLGIKYRIIYDRGVTLLDWRGLYKNPGL